jgi:hypothetical protein
VPESDETSFEIMFRYADLIKAQEAERALTSMHSAKECMGFTEMTFSRNVTLTGFSSVSQMDLLSMSSGAGPCPFLYSIYARK